MEQKIKKLKELAQKIESIEQEHSIFGDLPYEREIDLSNYRREMLQIIKEL